jgi:hypothetical protein
MSSGDVERDWYQRETAAPYIDFATRTARRTASTFLPSAAARISTDTHPGYRTRASASAARR